MDEDAGQDGEMSGKSGVSGLSSLDQRAAFRYIAVMIRDLSDLPSDPDQLKAKLFELASAAEEVAAQRDAALLENEKLLFILAEFKRALFGRRSEKLDPDQLQLIFDIAEAAAATTGEAGSAQDERAAAAASKKPRKPATRNRGMLPQHLPRIEIRTVCRLLGSGNKQQVLNVSRSYSTTALFCFF